MYSSQQAQLKLERELAGKRSEVLTLRQTMTVANEARVLAQGQLESLRTQVCSCMAEAVTH